MKLGDTIHILGHVSDLTEKVASMQVNHHSVIWVKPGEDVAVMVMVPVREHDMVYRIVEEVIEPRPA